MNELENLIMPDVSAALAVVLSHGGSCDSEQHKVWLIDQIIRALTGPAYDAWVVIYKSGRDGPDTYEWDCGIAP